MTDLPSSQGCLYSIHVQGHLPARLLIDFPGLQVVPLDRGKTQILVFLTDQSALYGLLDRLRDLNVCLIELSSVSTR
jgi:hypothetical protein